MSSLKRKKLLIVTNRFYPQIGGAERNIFLQVKELSKYYDIDVFTPLREKDLCVEEEKNIRIYRFYNLYNPYNHFPYIHAKSFCPKIFFKLLWNRYDSIHCFPAINLNNILVLFFARWRRIPIFLTNFDLFDYSDLMLRKKISFTQLNKQKLSRKQRYFLPKFNAIFTISEQETNLLKKINPRTFLSRVPIDSEEYRGDFSQEIQSFRTKFNLSKNVPIILCLSRIAYIKGQDIFLEGLSLLDLSQQFIAVIAGRTDYEPEYFQHLKNLVREKNLEDRVLFTGTLTRKDLIAAIKCCTFHVLPMRFMNSGAVIVETWASGKPVLQSLQIDPNYVIEGENGYTFSIDNFAELADKMKFFLENRDICEKMGQKGKEIVANKFLYRHLIEQYRQIYSQYHKFKKR